MLTVFRPAFYVGQLHLADKTQNIVKLYEKAPQPYLPHLLNFNNKIPIPFFISTLLQSKKHSQLFQLYLNYVQKGQQTPADIAYQFIQQNLRKKVLNELKNKKLNIKLLKYQMLSSKLIQQKEIFGVFLHRKYNLNEQSYNLSLNTNDCLKYQLKPMLHSSALALYQKNIRKYKADKMKQLYGEEFRDFIQQKFIVRYFYQIEGFIELEISNPSQTVIVGRQGPTKHLLQIESYFNTVSNLQQYFLTDVDYILQGNSYFKRRTAI